MQGVEHYQQTPCQVWTLLSPVPRLGKLHRLTTLEERGTQWLGGANPPGLGCVYPPGLGGANPPDLSTRICLTCGRFQDVRDAVSLTFSGQKSFLPPSCAWSQVSLRVLIPSSWSLHSTPGRLSNRGFAIFSFLACAISKFQRSWEGH